MSMAFDHIPRGYNFLGLSEEEARYEPARVVVLPVAYDGTTSYRAGTKYGPAAIIAASREVETFDYRTSREIGEIGITTALEVETEADGPAAMVDTVEREVARHLKAGKYVVMLGGEHSLTTGAVRAHKAKYPNLSVLHIDAHADMRDSFQGSKYSHASVMRRVREICPAVSVGIRNASADCMQSIKSSGAPVIWAEECVGETGWHDRAIKPLSDQVYITFDLDAFDPAIMPAVGTPEPGGLHWYETLEFLRAVFAQRTVVGFDVVELSPLAGLHHADFLAAKLVAEMIRAANS
ncbi:MAG: agmatinase [Candidatus Zixiibacteriota bacterium]